MNAIAEASQLIRAVAEPRPVGDSVKAALRRAARRAGLSFNRARDFWHADERIRPRAEEMDKLREIAAKREGSIDAGRRELRQLEERIQRLEALLRRAPANRSGPDAG